MRLGFPVKVLGQKGLKSNDSRRWQSEPHLRVSIGYLAEIFRYLEKNSISMYRMSSDVVPYATHPDLPQFHNQIRDCAQELRGQLTRSISRRSSSSPSAASTPTASCSRWALPACSATSPRWPTTSDPRTQRLMNAREALRDAVREMVNRAILLYTREGTENLRNDTPAQHCVEQSRAP